MKSTTKGLYSIYSQRVAGMLMLKGFTIKKLEENKKFSDKTVFVFANSPEFQKALMEVKVGNR